MNLKNNSKNKMYFTSESVSEGHPDKICDQISDAILDLFLKKDKNAHVACECFITKNKLIIGGEISSIVYIPENDIKETAKLVLKNIGYDSEDKCLDYRNMDIQILLHTQSREIENVVNKSIDQNSTGAGDQGIMFGYATNSTDSFMPLPITLANKIVKKASILRKNGKFKNAYPDMKSQVTIKYENGNKSIHSIVLSYQANKNINIDETNQYIKNNILKPILQNYNLALPSNNKLFLNPFFIGGPVSDTGLTGRKIIVDTYGGWSRHGGGAFSGKDPSKSDRAYSYLARYIAKNLVAAGIADQLEIQIGCIIGFSEPISICVNTFDSSKVLNDAQIIQLIQEVFELNFAKVIEKLNLLETEYLPTATYGHFGQLDLDFPWEKLNKVDKIKAYLNKLK